MDFLEQQAESAETAGDLKNALHLWNQVAVRSRDPVAFCRAGRVAQELGSWGEAENSFHEALRVDRDFSGAKECLGSLWLSRTDKDSQEALIVARNWFAQALKHERNARLLTFVGNADVALGDESSARKSFEEAIALDPNYEEALFNLASLESETDPEGAFALLEKAIRIDPEYSAAHRELGVLSETEGDLVKAEYHLRRALELDPADYWAQMHLANLLAVQGKNMEAEQTYRFATTLHPEIKEGTEIFARFLDSLGKREDADTVRGKPGDRRN
jgi:tetratricopeptide (TPR) repeat protein